ncbi:hypothetical protein [Hymenobacter canadensis]|uniref:Integrase catalytic domain-containing protein n=1 Tax=Hymenobacter canadensis TaxID=2999067 RepID=A0ABY7LXP7_9BACT|nr:hypothetical protein [Hymenobacter canadensis]WBA44349.1 hypothetical protein O3303_21315 [Hymenobacter canadensis]
MPTELVLLALEQALTLRQTAPGLIIHDDRGSQCPAQLQPAGQSLRQRPGRSRLEHA